MPRWMKVVGVTLGAACAISLSVVLLRPPPPEPPASPAAVAEPAPVAESGPGVFAERTRLVGRAGGERRWEFDADEVTVKQGESRVDLEGIRDGVLYDKGEVWFRFSAARAVADTSTDDLRLEDVSFTSKEGDRLSARVLTWSSKEEKVIVEGDVRVERDTSSVLLCERAEYRPGENVLETVGRTTVEIEMPGE